MNWDRPLTPHQQAMVDAARERERIRRAGPQMMNPDNRATIEAALDNLADTLTGDNGWGIGIDVTWDHHCTTIHITTGDCDHPNTGHHNTGQRQR